jgi:hypothetical protein
MTAEHSTTKAERYSASLNAAVKIISLLTVGKRHPLEDAGLGSD